MPEVTGTVGDPVRKTSFILKMEGPPATEVFAFNLRDVYNSKEILHLRDVPTLYCPTHTGNTDESRKGRYIMSDVFLQDSICRDGDRLCPITDVNFVKQATLKPFIGRTMTVASYLPNGEMIMEPVNKDARLMPNEDLEYPINLIEVGEVDDLDTPMGLTLKREKLKLASKEAGQSSKEGSDKDSALEGNEGEALDNTASTIITGTLHQGPRSTSNRVICPDAVGEDRAAPCSSNPEFTPWLASTGATPPSQRQRAGTPSEYSDTTDSGDSSGRPGSGSPTVTGKPRTSPTKRGKVTKRMKKSLDKSYRQPTIRGFLTPSPPKSPPPSPVGNRTPLPQRRNKRRSQRMDSEGAILPSPKRLHSGDSPDSLGEFHKDIIAGLEDSNTTEEIVLDEPEGPVKMKNEFAVDLSNDFTPETLEAAKLHEDPDTSNEAARKGGQYSVTPSPSGMAPGGQGTSQEVDKTSTTQSSSGGSMTTHSHDDNKSPSPTPGPSGLQASVHSNLAPGRKVTFHSNMTSANKPKHILIKAIGDHLSVKILTFEAYNIEDIVRCFFEEQQEFDDPGVSLDDTFQQLIDVSAQSSPNNSVISSIETFENTSIQTFIKTEPMEQEEADDGTDVIYIDVTPPTQPGTTLPAKPDVEDNVDDTMEEDTEETGTKGEENEDGEGGDHAN